MKGRKKIRKNEDGFSLLEILIAIIILALIAAPILQSFITTASINMKSRRLLAATDVAQAIMEEITSQTYDKDIKTKYADASASINVIPSLNFTASGNEVTGLASNSIDEFTNHLKSNASSVQSNTMYFCKWVENNRENLAVSFHNISFDGYKFDVIVYFKPNSINAADVIFTYLVTVDVYSVEDTVHYSEKLISINGKVINE